MPLVKADSEAQNFFLLQRMIKHPEGQAIGEPEQKDCFE